LERKYFVFFKIIIIFTSQIIIYLKQIKVEKADLIAKIKENKENHIVEYGKAVIAYKKKHYDN